MGYSIKEGIRKRIELCNINVRHCEAEALIRYFVKETGIRMRIELCNINVRHCEAEALIRYFVKETSCATTQSH